MWLYSDTMPSVQLSQALPDEGVTLFCACKALSLQSCKSSCHSGLQLRVYMFFFRTRLRSSSAALKFYAGLSPQILAHSNFSNEWMHEWSQWQSHSILSFPKLISLALRMTQLLKSKRRCDYQGREGEAWIRLFVWKDQGHEAGPLRYGRVPALCPRLRCAWRSWAGGSRPGLGLTYADGNQACLWVSAADTKQSHAGAPTPAVGNLWAKHRQMMSAPGLGPSVHSSVRAHMCIEGNRRGEGWRWMTSKYSPDKKTKRQIPYFLPWPYLNHTLC